MNWAFLKTKAAAVGAIALAVLAFFVRLKFVTAAKEKAEAKVEVLEVRQHVAKTQKLIEKVKQGELHSRRVDILKELKKSAKEFEGISNLSDPDDF